MQKIPLVKPDIYTDSILLNIYNSLKVVTIEKLGGSENWL
jgi:hypothetical protein